jgi:hypothetical protein
MSRNRMAMAKRIPAVLAAAAGIAAAGLLTTPVASAQPDGGQCPENQYPKSDGSGCAGIPDPTKYGCPPEDFECMFESVLGPKP